MSEVKKLPSTTSSKTLYPLSPLTTAIHGDNNNDDERKRAMSSSNLSYANAVGPDITVSTTFRIPPPADLLAIQHRLGDHLHHHSTHSSSHHSTPPTSPTPSGLTPYPLSPDHPSNRHPSVIGSQVYRRFSDPTLAQVEKVLSTLLNGQALVYSSGLSAAFAALMLIQPDVIAIRDGYLGSHGTIKRYCQMRGMNDKKSVEVRVIDLDDVYPRSETGLRVLVWLETPVNPTDAKKVRECASGSELLVDSTFAPPPLSNPFSFGADLVLYSGSKFFAGHSDALCGILVAHSNTNVRHQQLWYDRTHLGTIPGSLETWLLLRSIKTLQIRVIHQSETASRLAIWLNSLTERDYRSEIEPDHKKRLVIRVWHSSFQDGGRWIGFDPQTNLPRQMMGGGSPCFAFMLQRPIHAKWLPFCTKLFIPATSLGGVESLIQHQVQAQPNADPRIVRLSVGLEDFHDLKNDLIQAFDKVIKYERHSKL